MKWYKSLSFALLFLVTLANAQSANRFFYELTFKPKKGIDSLQKTVMILDVTDKKSLYRDYLTVSQDSVLKIEVEKMQKAGVFKDLSKSSFFFFGTLSYPILTLPILTSFQNSNLLFTPDNSKVSGKTATCFFSKSSLTCFVNSSF